MYEKYGIDPLKHSVNDYLLTLISWTVILHNLVCSSIWTWRILIGPLNMILAEFQGFIQCIFLSTALLNLAEISLIKVLIIYFFDGRSPSRHKQEFPYLAGALMEHLLEGIAPLTHWYISPNEKSNKYKSSLLSTSFKEMFQY